MAVPLPGPALLRGLVVGSPGDLLPGFCACCRPGVSWKEGEPSWLCCGWGKEGARFKESPWGWPKAEMRLCVVDEASMRWWGVDAGRAWVGGA
eukprot:1159806-Pelagomonas_calceolata.AAC.4